MLFVFYSVYFCCFVHVLFTFRLFLFVTITHTHRRAHTRRITTYQWFYLFENIDMYNVLCDGCNTTAAVSNVPFAAAKIGRFRLLSACCYRCFCCYHYFIFNFQCFNFIFFSCLFLLCVIKHWKCMHKHKQGSKQASKYMHIAQVFGEKCSKHE